VSSNDPLSNRPPFPGDFPVGSQSPYPPSYPPQASFSTSPGQFPSPPPQPPLNLPGNTGSRLWIWLLGLGGAFLLAPFCCCGGLLIFASSFTDFTIRGGEHLGGSPMNLRFDYELHNDKMMLDPYFIVARTADGTTREQGIQGWLNKRGTMHFGAFNVTPKDGQFPVKVWIEKESRRGGRSKASNVISVYAQK
jgi:hypothetical protein